MIPGSAFKFRKQFKAAGFLFFIFFHSLTNSNAQSYFSFETTFPPKGQTPVAYSLFLNIGADGNAAARITYTDAATGSTVLVDQRLDTATIALNGMSKKYLIPKGDARLIRGSNMNVYVPLRFLFEAKQDTLGIYYEPSVIEYQLQDGSWATAETSSNTSKTYEELLKNKEFVRKFYNGNDPFFAYLNKLNSRGLDNNQLNTRLYLITVANTTDTAIGASSKLDMQRMLALFSDMTRKLRIGMVPVTIWGESFNIANVKRTLDSIRPRPSDIVIFYYSGHGFRFTADASKYARMSFRTTRLQLLESNNLSLENDVYKPLLAKGARVTIVIGDCCNSYADAVPAFGSDLLRPRATGLAGLKLNFENCSKLFFGTEKVSIIVNSAQKNQVSCCNPKLGGFFTNFLNEQLIKSLYGNDGETSWLNILLKANENTGRQSLTAECDKTSNFKGRCVQKPEMYVWPLF